MKISIPSGIEPGLLVKRAWGLQAEDGAPRQVYKTTGTHLYFATIVSQKISANKQQGKEY